MREMKPSDGANGREATILFVDDDAGVLASIRDAFRKRPYRVLTANSAEEGLGILAENDVDVVVSDEKMPNMRGVEFLGIVHREYPDTIRIVLTGQASLDTAIQAINEGGIFRFMTKPCHAVDLAVTIQHGLQMRELASESTRLLAKSRRQREVLRGLEMDYPGIGKVDVDDVGTILLREKGRLEDLIRELQQENGAITS